MANIPHNIGKIEFELEATHERNARELQQKISGYGRKEIPDIIEEILDNLGINGSLAVIDKLEIDLGEIAFEEFHIKFLSLFKNRFSEKLSEFHFDISSEKKEDIRVLDKEKSDLEVLKYFLLTGRIPWYLESTPPDLQVIFKQLVETKSRELIQFTQTHISDDEFSERLVYQFPEPTILQLIETVLETKTEEYLRFVDQLFLVIEKSKEIAVKISYPGQIRLTILIEAISELKDKPGLRFEELLLVLLARKLSISYDLFLQQLMESIDELTKKAHPDIEKEFIIQLKEFVKKSDTVKKGDIEVKTTETEVVEKEVVPKPEEDVPTSYYISNAGLVLLHPFLTELFRKTGLIINKEFIDEQAIHKAMHLLQYAVFGNKARPEHLLILNKLLCGYPLDKPIPIRVGLSKTEKSEATRMVNAAIKHWSALKNTSAEGFRNSFLRRNGLLKQTEEGWRLYVEREAYDVLLDKIPWSYNIVKLPWMNKIIEVEW